jgi:hypothetical protein
VVDDSDALDLYEEVGVREARDDDEGARRRRL